MGDLQGGVFTLRAFAPRVGPNGLETLRSLTHVVEKIKQTKLVTHAESCGRMGGWVCGRVWPPIVKLAKVPP